MQSLSQDIIIGAFKKIYLYDENCARGKYLKACVFEKYAEQAERVKNKCDWQTKPVSNGVIS